MCEERSRAAEIQPAASRTEQAVTPANQAITIQGSAACQGSAAYGKAAATACGFRGVSAGEGDAAMPGRVKVLYEFIRMSTKNFVR